MAEARLTLKVLELDIVLAGVALGGTVLTVANPEGREIIVPRSLLRRITMDTTGDDVRAQLKIYLDASEQYGYTVKGALAADAIHVNNSGPFVWAVGSSLILKLADDEGLETAETFVGKLYVEYWGSARELGVNYSKHHANIYRGIRKVI